jgi:hypothetical protein
MIFQPNYRFKGEKGLKPFAMLDAPRLDVVSFKLARRVRTKYFFKSHVKVLSRADSVLSSPGLESETAQTCRYNGKKPSCKLVSKAKIIHYFTASNLLMWKITRTSAKDILQKKISLSDH